MPIGNDAYFQNYLPSRPTGAGKAFSNDDYTRDANPATILRDPRFLKDYREYKRRNGDDVSGMSDQDLIEDFFSNRTMRNVNTIGMVRDVIEANTADPEQVERLARIQKVWEIAPARSFTDAFGDYAKAILTDPVNLIGGAGAAKGALQAAKLGQKGLRAAATVAKSAAVSEAAANASISGATSLLRQQANKDLGLVDDVSQTDALIDAAAGGLLGGAVGGTIGAAAAKPALRSARKLIDDLTGLGVPPEAVERMTLKQAQDFVAKGTPFADPAAPAADPVDPVDPAAADPTAAAAADPEIIDPAIAAEARKRAEAQLDELHKEGANRSLLRAANQQVVYARELEQLSKIIKNMEENTLPKKAASDDAGAADVGRRNIARIEELRSLYRRLQEDPDAILLAEVRQKRAEAEAAKAAEDAAAAAEATGATPAAEVKTAEAPATEPVAAEAAAPAAEAPAAPAAEAPTTETVAPKTPADMAAIKVSRDAQRLADANGLDISTITPANPGKITVADVRLKLGEAERLAKIEADGKAPNEAVNGKPKTEAPAAQATDEPVDDEAVEIFDAIMDTFDEPTFRATGNLRGIVEKYTSDIYGPEMSTKIMRLFDAEEAGRAEKVAGEAVDWGDGVDVDGISKSMGEQLRPILTAVTKKDALARGATPDQAEAVAARAAERADARTAAARANEDRLPEVTVGKANGRWEVTMPVATASKFREEGWFDLRPARENETVVVNLVDSKGNTRAYAPASESMKFLARIDGRIKEMSATGKAAQTLATGPVGTGEGAKPGRPQGILKPGKTIEKNAEGEAERTITEGEVPTKTGVAREEIELRAAQSREITPWRTPIEMTRVIGGTTYERTNRKGKELRFIGYVPKGATVFYEPNTRRWYASEELAMKARGAIAPGVLDDAIEGRGLTKVASDEPDAEAPVEAATAPTAPDARAADKMELALQLARGEITGQEFQTRLAALNRVEAVTSPDPAKSTAAAKTNIQPKDGMVIAIRNREKPNDVRVLSKKQREAGADASALMGKADPAKFEVGFVPEGAGSFTQRAISGFVPATADDIAAAKTVAADIGPKGLRIEQLATITLDASALSPEEVAGLQAARSRLGHGPLPDVLPLAQLERLRAGLESARWPRYAEDLKALIDEIEVVSRLHARFIPDGIFRPAASRAEARKAIEDIFSGRPPEEAATALDFLNRLGGDTAKAPIFKPDDRSGFTRFAPSSEDFNSVVLGGEMFDGDLISFLPRLGTLYHEVAHWAYHNILTPADRAEFWQSMRKYYDADGKRLADAVAARAPYGAERTNALTSPQEFFANQFVGFVMQKRQRDLWENEDFWKRVWRYVTNTFNRFFGNDFIDADLEPLFAKIMPDREAAEASLIVPTGPLKTKGAKWIVAHYNDLNETERLLEEALDNYNVDAARSAGEDLLRLLSRLSTRSNPFKALETYAPNVREFKNRLYKALYPAGDDGLPDDIFEEGDAAVSEFLAQKGGRSVDPEAAFENLRKLMDDGGRLGDLDVDTKGSLRAIVDVVRGKLEQKFRHLEGTQLNPRRRLATTERTPAGVPPEASRKRVARATSVAKAKQAETAAEAIRTIKTEAAKRADPKPVGKALPETSNPKGKPVGDLIAAYRAAKSKKQAAKFAAEILAKQKASPLAYSPAEAASMKVAKDIPAMRKDQLQSELEKAMDGGDSQRVNDILFEAWRRQNNKRLADAGQPLIRPQVRNSLVKTAIDRHIAQSEGEYIDDGIIASAPANVREVQSYMEHRDPEVKIAMREVLYRALNLMGKTTRSALADANLMSVGDIYRLANLPQPVGSAGVFTDFRNPAFNKLRADLRKMAIGLTKGVSNPFDAMHEVYHLALRTGIFGDDDMRVIRDSFVEAAQRGEKVAQTRIERYTPGKTLDTLNEQELATLAEEWFAESAALHTMGKVAKGDMWAIRESGDMTALTMKSRLVTFAEQVIDAVAYLVNGLIGRNDIKQMFRRIDAFGDIFERRNERFLRAGAKPGGVAPEYAAAYMAQAMKSLPEPRARAILRFIGNGIGIEPGGKTIMDLVPFYHGTPAGERLADPDAAMLPGRGDWGRGIYLTRNARVANEVYANRATPEAMRKRALDLSAEGKIKPDDVETVLNWAEQLGRTRREISKLANEAFYTQLGLRGAGPDDLRMGNIADERVSDLLERVEAMRTIEQEIKEELGRLGYKETPEVFPAVVRARNPLDLRPGSAFKGQTGFISEMSALAKAKGYRGLVSFLDSVEADEAYSGPDLHGMMARSLGRDVQARNYKAALDAVNELIGELGYDSIRTIHKNTLDSGEVTPHETLVLIDHVDRDTGKRVSASQLVKSFDASEFDYDDPRFYLSKLAEVEAPNVSMLAAAEAGEDFATQPFLMNSLISMDAKGMPSWATRVVSSAIRRRPITGPDFTGLKKFYTALLGSQSQRLEMAGMKMPAEFMRNHFVDQHVRLAERVNVVRDALGKLSDADGAMTRWLKNSNPLKTPAQPDSHARIIRALRAGPTSPQWGRLKPEEVAAAKTIRGLLDAEFRTLRMAGVLVGEVKNYFPQVWRPETLEADQDGFIKALADYFVDEAKDVGATLSPLDAMARAQRVFANITEDEGFYVPPPTGTSREARSDHIDFQRLIRLEDPKFKKHAEALDKYLEQDLEGLLVKYFDGTTRRALQTERFGVLNHGFYDYLRVVEEGERGIAYLLSHNRVVRKDIKTVEEDGYATILQFTDETQMPFEGDEAGAREAAREAIDIYNREGEAAARAYLLSLDVNDPVDRTRNPLAPITSTYDHRVNAIVAAIRDFGGKDRVVPAREIEFAQNALRVAMKKPVDSGVLATDGVRNFSRGIRTFNAVTLLGFTTLSSLPDLVLPLIRSGSFKTHWTALKKFATDPDYREAIRNTGVAIESIVHQRMAGLFASDISGKLGHLNNAFFNATGLTPWTDMNRKIAGAVGFEMFKAEISRALSNRVPGAPLDAQNKTYRLAMRRLNRYGLGDYVERGETLDADALERPEVKAAVVKFANDSIFAPSPDDMPLWSQTPVGAIFWQLKSFPLMMTRFAGDMVSDIKAGDWKRPGMFLAIGPAFGAGALALKDVVQQRGGEDGDEATVRSRNWKKFLGYDEKLHGNEDDFLGWYSEGMLAMGGLGILADVLHSTAADVDNGAYGAQRVMSTFFGPSVGTFGSAVTVAGGLKDGLTDATPDSNAKERSATREFLRRIPVVGGIGGVREGLVDAAFEDTSDSAGAGGDDLSWGDDGWGGDDPSSGFADDLPMDGGLPPQDTEIE